MTPSKLLTVLAAAILLQATAAGTSGAGSTGHEHEVHWTYEGETGPERWGDLKPEFSACKAGHGQSPIDITGAVKADLPGIEAHYGDTTLRVINNGHAIQADYDKGSYAVIGGKRYDLLQFHFHGPSENTVEGKAFPLEGHLVHKSEDGKLAVIGVLYKEGKENKTIGAVWKNVPQEQGTEKAAKDEKINAQGIMPEAMAYYHFDGSLTTPPCTEGVSWNVLKTPVEISAKQIEEFRKYYKNSARPVQPLHGRVVNVSN